MADAKRKATTQASPKAAKKAKVTLQKDLIALADKAAESAGVISFAEAKAIWTSAQDGPGVTANEFATLAHILENYKFTKKGRTYLDPLAIKQESGTSMYKTIDGQKYDRSCLDLAAHLAKDGSISLADAKALWADVMDGNRVTPIEKKTIDYVCTKYTITDGSKKFFAEKIAEWEKAEKKKAAAKADKAAKVAKVAKKAEPEEKKEASAKPTFTMQKDLIALADKSIESGSIISHAEAQALWKSAEDGPGVTQNEFGTLAHILENYKFTKKARAYLDPLAIKQSSGSSLYKTIDAVKYDRSAMDLAAHLVKDGSISAADAKLLWTDVEDGAKVTEVEKRTIEWVMKKHTLTDGAKKFFDEKLAAWTA